MSGAHREVFPQAESKVVELTREKAELESHLEEDQEEMEEMMEKQRSLTSQIGTVQSQLSEANVRVTELEDTKHSLEKKVGMDGRGVGGAWEEPCEMCTCNAIIQRWKCSAMSYG